MKRKEKWQLTDTPYRHSYKTAYVSDDQNHILLTDCNNEVCITINMGNLRT